METRGSSFCFASYEGRLGSLRIQNFHMDKSLEVTVSNGQYGDDTFAESRMRENRTSGLMWREPETERWPRLRHWQMAKAARNSDSLGLYATAPALDPTAEQPDRSIKRR